MQGVRLSVPIRDPKGLLWPMLLFGLALVVYLSAFVVLRWYDWTVLTLPVDLKPGVVRSSEFRVDQKVNYLVELEVERNIPFDDLNCMFGESSYSRKGCAAIKSVVDLQWTLFSGSK